MWFELFLPSFLITFTLTAGCILVFLLVPLFRRNRWRSGRRHSKKRSLSRLGGVAMLCAFLVTFFLDPHLVLTRELLGLSAGILLIVIFGLWDDLSELDWKVQLFFQAALAVLIFIFGIRIVSLTNPFGGTFVFPEEHFIIPAFLLLFVWVLLVMNAMNWLDGLDGLCGGVALITLLTIFFLSLKPEVNQPPIALLALMGAGTVSGFLLFNVYPARILAGTTGSMFLGFLIAVLAVIAGTKIATALLVLSLPIADALFVTMERLWSGTSIFQPDERHLHYRLRKLGWSERKISGAFFSVTLLIAVIALFTEGIVKFWAILCVLGVVFSVLFWVAHRLKRSKVPVS